MSEARYFSPQQIVDFYNNQNSLDDTERYALKAADWARARLSNYHEKSDEIPGVVLKDGVYFVNTSMGDMKVPFDYNALHDTCTIEERKVIKVNTPEPAMDDMMAQQEPVANQGMGDMNAGEEEIMGDEGMEQNPYQADFDAGVEADEESDPKRYIQQLAGKLSQSLRSYNEELPSPDVDLSKYVMGMINKQAVKGLSNKDITDVLSKIKSDETEDDYENPDLNSDEMNGNEEDVSQDDVNQNESIKRNKINEIFQDIISHSDDEKQKIDKPITSIGYLKKPFTSPKFK